ncbi:hypothetical protein [Actinacidiphila sp. bgisy160]|uniref:hypothetical protein n=1 Tax=Actinacidiphila sp. bgisy160 TaxID=3413796 RepID=UPI003D71BE43
MTNVAPAAPPAAAGAVAPPGPSAGRRVALHLARGPAVPRPPGGGPVGRAMETSRGRPSPVAQHGRTAFPTLGNTGVALVVLVGRRAVLRRLAVRVSSSCPPG